MADELKKAETVASLFFRQSDERLLAGLNLKREDDRRILVYEIAEALSEIERLKEKYERM